MNYHDELTPMMDATADALGLTLPLDGRDAILLNLATILEEARVCEESLEGETIEIAAVFRP